MDHPHECDHSSCTHANASVSQTLSEMDWERGLWHAGKQAVNVIFICT